MQVSILKANNFPEPSGFKLDTKMQEEQQDFDINTEEAETPSLRELRVAQVKEYSRLTLKRVVAFICFGPGVLGFLWLISRILRR